LAPNDGLVWVLVLAAFMLGVASTLLVTRLRRGRQRVDGSTSPVASPAVEALSPGAADRRRDSPFPAAAPPLAAPVDTGTPGRALQAQLLVVTAERLPAGGQALVISPPGEQPPLVWHIHLGVGVVLAVPDGRTIPILAPPDSREWRLPSGRVVRIADGGREHQISHDTVTVQVTGPYLRVTLIAAQPGALKLTVTAFGDPRGPSELCADLQDGRAIEAALRQALDLAASSRAARPPMVLSYSRAGWEAHLHTWLDASAPQHAGEAPVSGGPTSR
jgi:hypothetical protein